MQGAVTPSEGAPGAPVPAGGALQPPEAVAERTAGAAREAAGEAGGPSDASDGWEDVDDGEHDGQADGRTAALDREALHRVRSSTQRASVSPDRSVLSVYGHQTGSKHPVVFVK
jgi:hypothetical protein